MSLVTAAELAPLVGVNYDTVNRWAKRGAIPSVPHGKRRRFYIAAVKAALAEQKRRLAELRTCSLCSRELSVHQFPTHVDKRVGRRYPCSNCYECRRSLNVEGRRKKAEREGRPYRTRQEIVRESKARAERERAEREQRATERVRSMELTAKQRKQRKERVAAMRRARDRERYSADPEYRARIHAKKIRRKRAMAGTEVVPVNRETVAHRDGWRCGICGKRVTRKNWSLDHIVPLSQGGAHTYQNVTLAHRVCNSKRGAGRLPVQAPLFADLAPNAPRSPPATGSFSPPQPIRVRNSALFE